MNVRTRALVAAGIVVIVAAGTIVLWGLIPLPSFAPLTQAPAPTFPGTIAYLRGGYGDEPVCVEVVTSTAPQGRSLSCYDGYEERWPDQLGWTTDGLLVVTLFDRRGSTSQVIDPVTGAIVDHPSVEPSPTEPRPIPVDRSATAEDVEVRNVDGRVTVTTGTEGRQVTVIDAEAPRSYTFWERLRSPDGAWLLLLDSEDRLVIVPLDGSAPARLVAEDARAPTWFVPGAGATHVVDLDDA